MNKNADKAMEDTRHTGNKQFQRFSRLNRTLHIFMILSFMTLALTGMTLKFSYTAWARIISELFGGYENAGYFHRFAAIVMFSVFFIHIADVFRKKREVFGSWKAILTGSSTLVPNLQDWTDLKASIKWFLGKGERPDYGKWTYWEKFDYFAVFWGMVVIGLTGLMLWFPSFFTLFLPGEVLNVATIIHSDEALLATGFIFTIHFFNTHLRPDKFPMDLVVFTGRMSLKEFKHDKRREYDELVEKGELEKFLVEPYQPIVIRGFRIFAWTALTIGFSMVIWIIYAMVFAYR